MPDDIELSKLIEYIKGLQDKNDKLEKRVNVLEEQSEEIRMKIVDDTLDELM